jgi:hypothetical protein
MAYSPFARYCRRAPQGHIYLIEGDPGAGKTTTGLQFLLAGNKQGDAVLYVTLSESEIELQRRPADLWRDYVGGPSAEHAGLVTDKWLLAPSSALSGPQLWGERAANSDSVASNHDFQFDWR